MVTFTIKYMAEIVFLSITFLLAAVLVDAGVNSIDLVFFSCLFMLFIPVFYLTMKNFGGGIK